MAEDHVESPTEYQLMEEEITSSSEKIYILTSSALPSHLRSLEVKHSGLVSSLNSSPCSSRVINIILILIFVFVTSITVSIAVYKITEITKTGNTLQSFHVVSNSNSTEEPLEMMMTTERENSTDYQDQNRTEVFAIPIRKNCAQKCHLYADKKFQSDCIFGTCVCRGSNYQFLTCLPSVGQCVISKGFISTANFSMDSVTSPVYSCRPDTPSEGNQLHILGVYGNHFATATMVYISGESERPVTLVLANYYPISWKIRLEGVGINQIILASQFSVDSSSVEVATYMAGEDVISRPTVRRLQIPVGFGNDIHNSKTVDMLRKLERYGSIRSFTGAEFADFISFQIPI